ncbi:MAG: Ppx/GppA family phosphatase [Schleiferilactobacillus perolens]|uniref:Ppx/GppA phosphatase family protein n=1 Tax=Schleiferilactobacillus perolens TaxID=100468 RepID=UPI0039ED6014
MENLVVIDLGSNSVRMTITEVHDDGTTKVVAQEKDMVRLSEDMGPEKILQDDAMTRTIEAMKKFVKTFKSLPNVHLHAVATAATRQAKNQSEFLTNLKDATGVEVKVISGEQEAYYDYLGVTNTLPVVNAVIMDTGGASIELIFMLQRRIQNLISIPMGSVSLTETYLDPEHITAPALFKLTTAMDRLYNDIWWLDKARNLPIVALGGSNRTLAKIERRRAKTPHFENIHGFRMSTDQVNRVFSTVIGADLTERKEIPGLSKDRADIIVGGMVPIVNLMRFLDSDRITFSQSGLREGVLYERLHEMKR